MRHNIAKDGKFINELIAENKELDKFFRFEPFTELRRVLSFSYSMLLAFPIGLWMRNRLRKNKQLQQILKFDALISVRNTIEKGSFAYDTLLFKQHPIQIIQNKSHLANLVCLAIMFGDEFIDGLAEKCGKLEIKRILTKEIGDAYLRYKDDDGKIVLYYGFDICTLLPTEVLKSINNKYNINYGEFYIHLQFLLSEMNIHLNKLKPQQAIEAAQLICKACNKCFDTYAKDVTAFDLDYNWNELLDYQNSKDDEIVQVLLSLRAVLLKKNKPAYIQQFKSWGSMLRIMQLYDDQQDILQDWNFQMNIIAYFAKSFFKEEWNWLQSHHPNSENGMRLHGLIAVNMPASCMLAVQYAKNISLNNSNWVQKKIQNYLWRKNWLGLGNQELQKNPFLVSDRVGATSFSESVKLIYLQNKISDIRNDLISEEMKTAYILDVALLDNNLRTFIFSKITRREKYLLVSNYIEFPLSQKAKLALKVLNSLV